MAVEIREPEKVKELRLPEILGVEEGDLTAVYDKESSTLNVTFDKHKIQIPQILSAVMDRVEIKDVQIQETELAQIVKEIYNHGMMEGA